jgi:hypothetical protein
VTSTPRPISRPSTSRSICTTRCLSPLHEG